jgi:four helix bundle protein
MTRHTEQTQRRRFSNPLPVPRGRRGLRALEVADQVAWQVKQLRFPRGSGHIKDHLIRAADNASLRLAEGSGRTGGNRYQHLEAAYAEMQEVQQALRLLVQHGAHIPPALRAAAHRAGGLIFGLLRAERPR